MYSLCMIDDEIRRSNDEEQVRGVDETQQHQRLIEVWLFEQQNFSLQERVLLTALVAYFQNREEKQAAANIVLGNRDEGSRKRWHDFSLLTTENFSNLLDQYERNPIEIATFFRLALAAIVRDPTVSSESEGVSRLKRYLKASLSLQIKLDRMCFLPSEEVVEQVPEYVPDGLSDMGSDPTIDPTQRRREKIRVDKAAIFSRYLDQIIGLSRAISQLDSDMDAQHAPLMIVEAVAFMVYEALPYDPAFRAGVHGVLLGRSIASPDIHHNQIALCRHHALETQVLLQAFGIHTQLFKCYLSIGGGSRSSHVANLVELNGAWYVLDTTNPEKVGGKRTIYLKRLEGVGKNPYKDHRRTFVIDEHTEKERRYKLRRNMYYRIRDNQSDPLR